MLMNRFFVMFLCTLVFGLILILHKQKKLSSEAMYNIFIAFIMVSMITEAIAQMILFGDPWYTKMPLDLCNIAGITVALGLYLKNEKLNRVNYFISLGVYAALLTPDNAGLGNLGAISLYCFYFKHMYILFGLYYYYYENQTIIKFMDMIKAIISIAGFALIAALYNSKFGTNFMYVSAVPDFESPLSYFGTGAKYIVTFGALVITIIIIAYGLYNFIFNRRFKASK